MSDMIPSITDRQALVPRRLTYVFSMRVVHSLDNYVDHELPQGMMLPMDAVPLSSEDSMPRHVLGDELVPTATGEALVIPRAHISRGGGGLMISRENAGSFEGRLVCETEGSAVLAMEHRGVLNIRGGTIRIAELAAEEASGSISGTVRSAFICRVPTTKLRWMMLNQLVGIGAARVTRNGKTFRLDCDYDLYVGF